MQTIHVSRYGSAQNTGWQGSIEPEDRSWILFIHDDGTPILFRRALVEGGPDIGKVEHGYVDVELPCEPIMAGDVPTRTETSVASYPGPLDYEVFPTTDGDGKSCFAAKMSARQIIYTGDTEHEAIRSMLNDVARLCTAGCLDHTGRASNGNKRRYAFVEQTLGRPTS